MRNSHFLSVVVIGLSIGVVGLKARAEERKPEDPPIITVFPMTALVGKDCEIRVETPQFVWMRPRFNSGQGSTVRRGVGACWLVVGSHLSSGTVAHWFLEVEPLDGRSLKAAVSDAYKELSETVKHVDAELVGKPEPPKKNSQLMPNKSGKLQKRPGYLLKYQTRPPMEDGSRNLPPTFEGSTFFFQEGEAMISLTAENFAGNRADWFPKLVQSVMVAPSQRDPPPRPFKLVFRYRHISRFVLGCVPVGFEIVLTDSMSGADALWIRRMAGSPSSRLAVSTRDLGETLDESATELWKGWRRGYQYSSDLLVGKIAGEECRMFWFIDESDPVLECTVLGWHAFTKLHDKIVVFTFVTSFEEADLVALENQPWEAPEGERVRSMRDRLDAEFLGFLKTINLWAAKP